MLIFQDKGMREMFDKVLSRIDECALRENTTENIQQVQKFLEKEINDKCKNIKGHLNQLGKQIDLDKAQFNQNIQNVKRKTLGKITGKI